MVKVNAVSENNNIKNSNIKNLKSFLKSVEKLHASGLHFHHAHRSHYDKLDTCEFSVAAVALRSGRINTSGALLYCSNYCAHYCCGSPSDGVDR